MYLGEGNADFRAILGLSKSSAVNARYNGRENFF